MVKYNNKKILIILILAILILIILLYFVNPGFLDRYSKNKIVHIQKTPVIFEITDQKIIGIDVDTDALKLGTIMKGNFIERKLTVVNPFLFDIQVLISFSKNIDDFVNISSNDFVLNNNENKTLIVTLNPSNNASNGNYSGIMKVVMKKI